MTNSPRLDTDRRTPPTLLLEGREPVAPRPAVTHVVENFEIHSAEPIPPDAPPPEVPGYRIEGVLGGGGMGVVYRAVDLMLGRPVALKMIASEHASPLARERFRTEARTVARLRHANVVQIYEVGEHAGRPFLALEYVDGGSLAERLVAQGSLPARDAAQLVATLARAVAHAHEQGVIHRDLKPHNVLLAGGAPKITDFGLAKILDSDQSRTRSGVVLGTPAYMAPEQARGGGSGVTPASDVYALGVILFECLTGRPPFDGEASWDVLRQVIAEDAPPPSCFQPRLARDLDTICLKCLQKDPTRRYASATALADDLERFAAGEAIAARPDGPLRKLGRKLRRRPLTVSLVLLLSGAIALAGGFWQLRRSQAETALENGRQLAQRGDHLAAAERFLIAKHRLGRLPGCESLRAELFRSWAAAELRGLVQKMVFRCEPDHLSTAERRSYAESCRRLWDQRELILSYADSDDLNWESQIRADLRDLFMRGLELRLWPTEESRRMVDDLEALGAPSRLIDLERAIHRGTPAEALPARDLTTSSDSELHLLGRTYRRVGRIADAEACFRDALRLNSKALGLHFDLAALAYDTGRYDQAVTSYTACLAIQSEAQNEATFLSRRGFARLALDDTTLARADFEDAIKLGTANGEAHFGRGQVFRKFEQFSEARTDFEAALENGYPRERVLYPLAVTLLDLGAPDEARRRLQQLLTLRPGDRDALAMIDELDRRSGTRKP